MSRTGSEGVWALTPRIEVPFFPPAAFPPSWSPDTSREDASSGRPGSGYTISPLPGGITSADFSKRAKGNRVETVHAMGGSGPRRSGRNETTRESAPPGGISGNQAGFRTPGSLGVTERETAGNRFPSAEQVTVRSDSREANASEACPTRMRNPRRHHSDRMPERMIRLRFMLRAR